MVTLSGEFVMPEGFARETPFVRCYSCLLWRFLMDSFVLWSIRVPLLPRSWCNWVLHIPLCRWPRCLCHTIPGGLHGASRGPQHLWTGLKSIHKSKQMFGNPNPLFRGLVVANSECFALLHCRVPMPLPRCPTFHQKIEEGWWACNSSMLSRPTFHLGRGRCWIWQPSNSDCSNNFCNPDTHGHLPFSLALGHWCHQQAVQIVPVDRWWPGTWRKLSRGMADHVFSKGPRWSWTARSMPLWHCRHDSLAVVLHDREGACMDIVAGVTGTRRGGLLYCHWFACRRWQNNLVLAWSVGRRVVYQVPRPDALCCSSKETPLSHSSWSSDQQ